MDKELINNLEAVKENDQTIAENIVLTNEKLDSIGNNLEVIKKSSTSKLPIIIAIIALLVTFSGVSVIGIIDGMKSKTKSEVEINADESQVEPGSEYKIYLYSEYSKFDITTKINMTASLNFETDVVSITAYLASGAKDTVFLDRKNATEWQKKVEFTETGIHKIVVVATAPNGKVIENSIEVEVVSPQYGY